MHHNPSVLATDGPLAVRHRATVLGTAPDIVVLSHGFGTDQTAWRHIVPTLTDRFTVVLYDLPGAGPLLPDDFNPARYRHVSAYADDLLSLLDEMGIHRCRFVGHSVSSMVGALASVEDPSRFERLVMVNGSARYLNDDDYQGGFEQSDLNGLYQAIETNYEGWVAGFTPMAVGADVPEAVAQFAEGFLSMRPDITSSVAKTIFESDLRPIVSRIPAPVGLIQSLNDIAVPKSATLYLNTHIPNNRLVWIGASGHLPHMSAPDDVSSALVELL